MNDSTRRFIEDRLLTTQELAALLEVPAVTIQQWASRHKIDWVLKGGTYLFDREDFNDFQRPGVAGRPGRRSKDLVSNIVLPESEPLNAPSN